jgi:hypothetical protein
MREKQERNDRGRKDDGEKGSRKKDRDLCIYYDTMEFGCNVADTSDILSIIYKDHGWILKIRWNINLVQHHGYNQH